MKNFLVPVIPINCVSRTYETIVFLVKQALKTIYDLRSFFQYYRHYHLIKGSIGKLKPDLIYIKLSSR